jgi:hypothetical protein
MDQVARFSTRGLWFRWTLLSAAGLAAGLFAGAFLGAPVQAVVGMMLVTPVLTVLGGAVLGTAQWLELRRRFARAGWWVAASAAGLRPVQLSAGSQPARRTDRFVA